MTHDQAAKHAVDGLTLLSLIAQAADPDKGVHIKGKPLADVLAWQKTAEGV